MADELVPTSTSNTHFRQPEDGDSGSPLDQLNKDEIGDFITSVAQFLEPGFIEPISEETRKSQRTLLGVCLAVILLATGAVGVKEVVKTDGLEFSVKPQILLLVGTIACSYLEVLVVVRCFAEWKFYKLKNELADRELRAIFNQLRETKSEFLLRKQN